MRLKKDSPAIDFETIDYLGNDIKLSNIKEKKVFLTFFRGASCPFCNLRVRELIQKSSEFEKYNLQVMIFFKSDAEEIKNYAGKQNAPFPIIPDPEKKIYELYGVESSFMGTMKVMAKPATMMKAMTSGFFSMKSMTEEHISPAEFLIDENMIIKRVLYASDPSEHIDIDEILQWAKNTELNKG